MAFSLVQYRDSSDRRGVAAMDAAGDAREIVGVESTYALARAAAEAGRSLAAQAEAFGFGGAVDLTLAEAQGRMLAPIDHPDPAHLLLSGTGLTHLGSAEGRDRMHRAAAAGQRTDSMKMFQMGLQGGKPPPGEIGVQPEWFYKGSGAALAGPGQALVSPAFALDFGEEPELAGIYLIGPDGTPLRLGFALANEFSDHVTERGNYLWLAHSKLRPAALGPELRTGPPPPRIEGMSRIYRAGAVLWEKSFATGEEAMSHSIDNLERHHFKYPLFRRPGDVHVHFFGTATLSFSDGVRAQAGDVFEVSGAPFRFAVRNPVAVAQEAWPGVRAL